MQSGRIKKWLCLLCFGLATAVMAQDTVPSGLQRVLNVDDPELAELIRVAIENQEKVGHRIRQEERLDLIREVTRRYAQVKLLDEQVAEVARKLKANTGPAEVRYELLMAKAELEAKRMTELADLRKVVGVIPRHPFEKQPIEVLNTLLHLDPLKQGVVVMDTQKPFLTWPNHQWESGGLLSTNTALDYVRAKMSDKSNLPIDVIIYVDSERKVAAEKLANEIRTLAREFHVEYGTQIEMDSRTWIGTGQAPFIVRDGRTYTFYPQPVRRPNASGNEHLSRGVVEPRDLEAHIIWRLTKPKNVPVTFRIEYDRGGFDEAQRIAGKIKDIAKRFNLAEVVDVKTTLVEPLPISAFTGAGRAITPGEIRSIDIKPQGCADMVILEGRQHDIERPLQGVQWTPGMKSLYIDTKRLTTYKADLDDQGHLVLDRGQIYPQGSWNDEGGLPITFEKARICCSSHRLNVTSE